MATLKADVLSVRYGWIADIGTRRHSHVMVQKTKHISLPEAEAIARAATRDALAQHPQASWFADPNVTLGTFFPDENHYEFRLYLAAEKPSDGVILTTATVDRITGAVGVALHTSEWTKPNP